MTTTDRDTAIHQLERYYNSRRLPGLLRSGYAMLRRRRVRRRSSGLRQIVGLLHDVLNLITYIVLIGIPAVFLDLYQGLLELMRKTQRGFSSGSWQWALHFSLREDLAHHTVETVGYHELKPEEAREADDLAAWIMTLIQFLWGYEELMGVVWDEWTMVRLVDEAAQSAGLGEEELFRRLPRQWEVARPYDAPLNGTYADVRRITFENFITPRFEALPTSSQLSVQQVFNQLKNTERPAYQKQMSLLVRIVAGTYRDDKKSISLWDTAIGVILNGHYYLVDLCVHDDMGNPVVFGPNNTRWSLQIINGEPYDPDGEKLRLVDDQFFRVSDGAWAGYLDMAPFSSVKMQANRLLNRIRKEAIYNPSALTGKEVDILLAETPRREQENLRVSLSADTQESLRQLGRVPIILNWDLNVAGGQPLAQLRRVQRGVGDHALTVIRMDESFLFDQHHIFFDGTWSLAMAEVLTNTAIAWCERGLSVAPGDSPEVTPLYMEGTASFVRAARQFQELPEISAETTIHDISQIFNLRKMIEDRTGVRLTINDLLVTTRLFHAVHYEPTEPVRMALDSFYARSTTPETRKLADIVTRSIARSRHIHPSLAIPIDASSKDPRERIYLLTFRNIFEDVVWTWDDTWDAYQSYRRIEPPDTPEGEAAFRHFEEQRANLINTLRTFSHLLAASKEVALRGESFSVSVFNLLSNIPARLQYILRRIPEQVPSLNEIIRGDEIYSNIGRVSMGSSLSRFITAKDDGNAKSLAWGIMSNDHGRMVVTMRDFRPHVEPLIRSGNIELAQILAQDYVQTYTNNLMGLVARLFAMLIANPPESIQ